jgi:hypothetical protein
MNKKRPGVESGHESFPLEIHHAAFVREGIMVAMPLGFPGATTAIDPNDSRITALALRRDNWYETIYGGTSGKRAHVFFGWLRGVTGVIVDLGGDGESTETAGVACTHDLVVAALNGPKGGRLLRRKHPPISYDCIQEWTMDVHPLEVATEVTGARIVGIGADAVGTGVIGASAAGLFTWNPKDRKIKLGPDLAVIRLVRDGAGTLFGVCADGVVCLVSEGKTGVRAKKLAKLSEDFRRTTACDAGPDGGIYLASAAGTVFSVNRSGRVKRLGRTHLSPVACLAAVPDGRLFGFCGNEISNLFVYEPWKGKFRDLGVALSVLNRRRYGYEFSCAVTNRDGHVLFGEGDRGGHLWILFPSLATGRDKWR